MNSTHTDTVGALDQGIIEEALVPSMHEIMEGTPTEHISMGGDEELAVIAAKPETVRQKLELTNWVRGLSTELVIFEEGFLKVRERHKKKTTKDHLVNLRFMSPTPTFSRRIALRTLYWALGLTGAAALAWLIAEFTSLARFFVPTAVVFATAAIMAFLLCVYRTREKIQFSTAHGDTVVVSLMATLGCYGRCRKLIPEISKVVEEAAADRLEIKTQQLRAEMQEHYRLRDAGVITPEACATGTRKILSSFG